MMRCNVTDKIVKTGSVNTSIPGQYEIVYTVRIV